MFYPVDSLKRGGRFYLCWVADSWPLRFATITHRQLWSQDIRKICDDLIEVMTNESGRPANRFSLRLSSQLMRGLVRLYQRKVTVFLSDLCMISANVMKNANKKYMIFEDEEQHQARVQQLALEPMPAAPVQEEPEQEQRIEEIMQNSGNVVTNIQDITLKEAAIPEFQLPPNDGFGEETLDQALQLAIDRTMEMMLAPDASAAQLSGLGLAGLDATDRSHDRSRLAPVDLQMEHISEQDITIFKRSAGESLLPAADFEKDIPEIPIPEIPDIPIPELAVPQEKQQEEPPQPPVEVSEPEPPTEPPVKKPRAPALQPPEEIELEELEETEPQAKRRRHRKLIIDKKTKISANSLRARLENPLVELRCEDSSDDIIDIQVPYEVYMRRPCRAGRKLHSNLATALTRLFMRNLGVVNKPSRLEKDLEEAVMDRRLHSHTRSMLERIEEVEEPSLVQERPQPQLQKTTIPIDQSILAPQETTIPVDQSILAPQEVNIPTVAEEHREQDIADMLTQKIDTVSQRAEKRASEVEAQPSPPKKRRSAGYVSFGESQRRQRAMETAVPVEPEIPPVHVEDDKENRPANEQQPPRRSTALREKSVTALLHEAGLADVQTHQPPAELEPTRTQDKVARRSGSGSSETPLGSLDRTKVSLGEPVPPSDSIRFIRVMDAMQCRIGHVLLGRDLRGNAIVICRGYHLHNIRDQWGNEGTMIKILKCIKEGRQPVTVKYLLEKGPVIPGYKRIIAALCFTSILKLKQYGFILVQKSPETLEIDDIMLGPKFQ